VRVIPPSSKASSVLVRPHALAESCAFVEHELRSRHGEDWERVARLAPNDRTAVSERRGVPN